MDIDLITVLNKLLPMWDKETTCYFIERLNNPKTYMNAVDEVYSLYYNDIG